MHTYTHSRTRMHLHTCRAERCGVVVYIHTFRLWRERGCSVITVFVECSIFLPSLPLPAWHTSTCPVIVAVLCPRPSPCHSLLPLQPAPAGHLNILSKFKRTLRLVYRSPPPPPPLLAHSAAHGPGIRGSTTLTLIPHVVLLLVPLYTSPMLPFWWIDRDDLTKKLFNLAFWSFQQLFCSCLVIYIPPGVNVKVGRMSVCDLYTRPLCRCVWLIYCGRTMGLKRPFWCGFSMCAFSQKSQMWFRPHRVKCNVSEIRKDLYFGKTKFPFHKSFREQSAMYWQVECFCWLILKLCSLSLFESLFAGAHADTKRKDNSASTKWLITIFLWQAGCIDCDKFIAPMDCWCSQISMSGVSSKPNWT